MSNPDFSAMIQAVVDGNVETSQKLAKQALTEDQNLIECVEKGFVQGIRKVGDLWEEGEYFLPELVQGAQAMKAAMEVINPALSEKTGSKSSKGRVVIGTVAGDMHDIGKSLVATLLAANGFEVYDLGFDVPIKDFIEKSQEVDAQIIGASALLTTTMVVQRELMNALRDLDNPPSVMVGGAPTSKEWADQIGAVHAENAMQAITVAETLVK